MYNNEHRRSLGRVRSRRWRQGQQGTVVFVIIGLALATVAWLALVFAPTNNPCWHKFQEWQGSPAMFPWQGLEDEENERDGDDNKGIPVIASSRFGGGTNRSHDLALKDIVFGIAGSAQLWPRRQEFVKLWWSPGHMRGFVWLEEAVKGYNSSELWPPVRISEDISRFRYTNPTGHPSGLRIARIIQESFRMGLPDVKWFVLGDDDTIFNSHNLVAVLNKYDPSEMYYIGNPSESHSANTYFSHSMAFGGGGIAISYPLAEALAEMMDECLERYPQLFGSDDRLHACISEIGVPLTREPGFHQMDIRGNAFGFLAAHPIAPFVSMHHVEAINPIFPQRNPLDGLRHLTEAMKTEPTSFLQRSICYDLKSQLSFSVSMGYVVQVFPKIVYPRVLERPELTFKAWNKKEIAEEFDFDSRRPYKSFCRKPFLFFLKDIHRNEANMVVSTYKRDEATDNMKRKAFCFSWALPPQKVQEIQVINKPVNENWHLTPRRQCCKLTGIQNKVLGITVMPCEQRESSSV
uniref:Uncharacterized protein n=1 Tax=Araucaria cunninghamii TaxID=56994 RepID=A0A0D6R035_ARACU